MYKLKTVYKEGITTVRDSAWFKRAMQLNYHKRQVDYMRVAYHFVKSRKDGKMYYLETPNGLYTVTAKYGVHRNVPH